eukprot:TRINITY_DN23605_c0_g1_i1.p1 TRINITY_DN23605_c0_g1~~TRINITY_DN23605_c0_g1_i1.p1  ORF type:complete len:539 (-),score=105.11 TRINITY_DN23605_c0_g1_i1:205-1821(-)
MLSPLQSPPSVSGLASVIRRKFTQPSRATDTVQIKAGLNHAFAAGLVPASATVPAAAIPEAPQSAGYCLPEQAFSSSSTCTPDTVQPGSSSASSSTGSSDGQQLERLEPVIQETEAASETRSAAAPIPALGDGSIAGQSKEEPMPQEWQALGAEFETQKRIWESRALLSWGGVDTSSTRQAQDLLRQMIETALEAVSTDAKGAARVLEAALRRDHDDSSLLSRATFAAAVAAVESVPDAARGRRDSASCDEDDESLRQLLSRHGYAGSISEPCQQEAAESLLVVAAGPGTGAVEQEVARLAESPSSPSASSSPNKERRLGTTTVTSSESTVAAESGGEKKKTTTCDKCDGPHPTDSCPHFKKAREKHKDAWVNYGSKTPKQMGVDRGKFVLYNAKCVRQPGDGSCLYHSLCYGLNSVKSGAAVVKTASARELRSELAAFVERNPMLEIAGDTIEEWVRWDSNSSVTAYARKMANSSHWGGGIEMASCALLKKVNIHVYERRWLGGYKRISCFEPPQSADRTIHVLYQGGVHYDALALS